MPKQRKLADPVFRAQVEEDLKVMTRAAACKKHGLDYNMIRREFGNAWKHTIGQTTQESEIGTP